MDKKERKLLHDKMIYEKIQNHYTQDLITIADACKLENINERTYYLISKRLKNNNNIIQVQKKNKEKKVEKNYFSDSNDSPIERNFIASSDKDYTTSTSSVNNDELKQLSEVWENNYDKKKKFNVLKIPKEKILHSNNKDINAKQTTTGGSKKQKYDEKTRKERLKFLKKKYSTIN